VYRGDAPLVRTLRIGLGLWPSELMRLSRGYYMNVRSSRLTDRQVDASRDGSEILSYGGLHRKSWNSADDPSVPSLKT
jgi:hypothetical protein